MERIKFIIVEQSYLVRKGIASIINRIDHATVVKELEDLSGLNSAILKYQPDFVVLNLSLMEDLHKYRNSEVKINLETHGIGIDSGNVHSKSGLPSLRQIIGLNDERDHIYSKFQSLIDEILSEHTSIIKQTELSDREKTILILVAKGMTNKEIAGKLFLSTHTVITHRKNITTKLGIKTISGLTVYAILNNFIKLSDLNH